MISEKNNITFKLLKILFYELKSNGKNIARKIPLDFNSYFNILTNIKVDYGFLINPHNMDLIIKSYDNYKNIIYNCRPLKNFIRLYYLGFDKQTTLECSKFDKQTLICRGYNRIQSQILFYRHIISNNDIDCTKLWFDYYGNKLNKPVDNITYKNFIFSKLDKKTLDFFSDFDIYNLSYIEIFNTLYINYIDAFNKVNDFNDINIISIGFKENKLNNNNKIINCKSKLYVADFAKLFDDNINIYYHFIKYGKKSRNSLIYSLYVNDDKLRPIPIEFNEFVKIWKKYVNNININASEEYFKLKYNEYANSYDWRNWNVIFTHDYLLNNTTNFAKEYWLSRGYSEDESINIISNRQRRDINFYKEKYNEKWEEKYNERSVKVKNNLKKYWNEHPFDPKNGGYSYSKTINPNTGNYYTYEEALELMKSNRREGSITYYKNLKSKGIKNKTVFSTEYWMDKGLSLEESIAKINSMMFRSDLKSCIERWGIELGTKKFNNRNLKYINTMNNKSDEEKKELLIKRVNNRNIKRYSKSATKLFERILKILNTDYNINFDKIFYKDNEYFIYDNKFKKIYFYDFCLIKNNIKFICEYNGILYHPNKLTLSDEEWKKWKTPVSNISADKQYKKDVRKEQLAREQNFEYLIVWENESFQVNVNIILNKIKSIFKL